MARRHDDVPPGLDPILLPGERLVTAVRAHSASITEPIVSACLGLAVAIWVDSNVTHGTQAIGTIVWWLFFALLVRMLWRLLDWHHNWFVATDKRLLLRYGIITHKVAMMPLIKVTDMSYVRSIPGQLLGYGRFVLESAGQDQALREIKWVPKPDETYRAICAEIFHITPTTGRAIDGDDADPDGLEDLGEPGGPGTGPGSGPGSGGGWTGSPTGYGGYPGGSTRRDGPPASPITPGGRGPRPGAARVRPTPTCTAPTTRSRSGSTPTRGPCRSRSARTARPSTRATTSSGAGEAPTPDPIWPQSDARPARALHRACQPSHDTRPSGLVWVRPLDHPARRSA